MTVLPSARNPNLYTADVHQHSKWSENINEINACSLVSIWNPRAVTVTSTLMWGPRHGQCCGCIFLGPICQWIPWEEISLSLNCPTQTVTRSMWQISFSHIILITTAFYHGRVIFKILFIFPLLKSGNIKVAGGEIFCSGSMLCLNNPLEFIFWEDRSLCSSDYNFILSFSDLCCS